MTDLPNLAQPRGEAATALATAPAIPALPDDLEGLVSGMPLSLRIMLDESVFRRVARVADYMSKARGITPPHLLSCPEACFAVVSRSITWRLDPFAVAQCTYQTPGGQVGYFGRLVQAILENSGWLEGPVEFQHVGDWERVAGKFEIGKSSSGKDVAKQLWTADDARVSKCGVIVRAKVKGETKSRVWPGEDTPFYLYQAFPLNSTLWATDPKTQICYLAVRRFASIAAPGIMMGVPFDVDGDAHQIIDVTPAVRIPPSRRPAASATLEPVERIQEPAREPEQEQDPFPPHDSETGELVGQLRPAAPIRGTVRTGRSSGFTDEE